MELMPLKDVLSETLKKMGISRKINAYSVIENWEKIVGKEIADNSWPSKVDRKTLVLRVINPVWSHHLLMLKADLLKKINTYLGQEQILDIWFMAGYEKKSACKEEKNENDSEEWIRPLRLDACEIAAAREAAKEIKDKKMRNKLIYVIIKQMAIDKAKKSKGWKQCATCEALVAPEKKYCVTCSLSKKETVQKNNLKGSKETLIKKILLDSPWLSYAEVNENIPCLPFEYKDAKKKLAHILIKKLLEPGRNKQISNGENNIKTSGIVLAMLLSEIRPENLTQLHIDNTISQIRSLYS